MDIITLSYENLESEHICCAIADKKGDCGAVSKKAWLKERFSDGLIFKKLDVRGKAFIEYIPAENAWCPIVAGGYMHINCFWISGRFKGNGYSNLLLDACISDAKSKGMLGLTVLSAKKKMPFLSDPKYLKYKGFKIADIAEPYYELFYLPFSENTPMPKFKEKAKTGETSEDGLVLYYSNQCPHTEKYTALVKIVAAQKGVPMKLIKFERAEEAQNSPAPFTTYSLYYNGKFVTNEILSEEKFKKFLDEQDA